MERLRKCPKCGLESEQKAKYVGGLVWTVADRAYKGVFQEWIWFFCDCGYADRVRPDDWDEEKAQAEAFVHKWDTPDCWTNSPKSKPRGLFARPWWKFW